jgi:uncharacterized membrane protein YbhN (UPF0104 family)
LSAKSPSVISISTARSRRKKWAICAFQIAVTLLVLVFVARQLLAAIGELKERQVSFADLQWKWFALAGACYFFSMIPAAGFWRWCLLALGNKPGLFRSYRAFLVGGVGKYVPGKAAVVFLRTVLVAGPNCSAASAGVAVFIETLTMMGVGGFLAAMVVLLMFRDQWWIAILSVGLAVGVLLPTIPRITRLLAKTIRLQRLSGDILERLEGWNTSLVARGWVLESANWILQSLAVWICLRALPETFYASSEQLSAARSFSESFPIILASTAVSTVVGFLVLIPAGLGVREVIVLNMLAPVIGHPAATTVSVLSRVVMILVDVLTAAVLYPIPSRDPAESISQT